MKSSAREIPFFILSFFVPLVLFSITSSSSLMFDDAGEFALVINLGSIAHPPGFPSYILSGMIWEKLTDLFGMDGVGSLTLYSSICVSASSLLLFMTFRMISFYVFRKNDIAVNIVSLCTALAFSTGATAWSWGNTVEAYAFQALSMSLALYGLTCFHFTRKTSCILIAATGIACGLSNHHLTMILFLPFVLLFFTEDLFARKDITATKKRRPLKMDSLTV